MLKSSFSIFFCIGTAYAISSDGQTFFENSQNPLIHDSGIINVPSNYFQENKHLFFLLTQFEVQVTF